MAVEVSNLLERLGQTAFAVYNMGMLHTQNLCLR